MKRYRVREIAIAAGLAAFSAVVQLIHVGYQSPQFGMWIDFVAVTWIIAFFLFGLRMSLVVSLVGALVITLFAPDTWLGASMKWIASVPMWLILGIWLRFLKKNYSYYGKIRHLLVPLSIALVIRCLIIIPVNYFYAIPIWTGMSPEKAMIAIPWFVIGGFNIVQGIFEVILAWLFVFRFRLKRYVTWK